MGETEIAAHEAAAEAHGTVAEGHREAHQTIIFLCVMLTLCILFFVSEQLMHKYHPRVGHETGVIIILGFLFSIIYFFAHGETALEFKLFQFRPHVFFNLILPPIVFNSGYNMRQKVFFANLGNIAVTGIVVTLVNFVIYSVSTYYVIAKLNLTMTRYQGNLDPTIPVPETLPIDMSFMQVLMFTSLMCSSDVVAAVSIIDF